MVPNKNSHELLIFDYAPNLKIVGAFHALNAQDKQDLERLITESDFVALENDEHRRLNNNGSPDIALSIPYSPTHWDEKSQRLVTNIFDLSYLVIFTHLNRHYIASFNARGNRGRTTGESESDFCHDVASKKNKPVYLVDIPIYLTLEKLASLNPLQKALHLLTLRFDRNSPDVKRILDDEREDYMLRQIERHERRKIKNLRRKGLLVVGYDHAANYYGNAGLAKLPEKTFK